MDAALLPEAGQSSLAPQSLRDTIAKLADEHGVIPSWTRWWPQETLRTVIPDDLVDAIDRACPQLPVTYFDQHIEVPQGWASAPNAYLAFGGTYAAELGFARGRSWPTDSIDGTHLHFLHQPEPSQTAYSLSHANCIEGERSLIAMFAVLVAASRRQSDVGSSTRR